MKNQKGQGIVESLMAIPVLFLLVTGLGSMTYFALNYQVASYHVHEALLCAQSLPLEECRSRHLRQIRKLLIFKEGLQFRLSRSGNDFKASLQIQTKPPIKIHQKLPKEF